MRINIKFIFVEKTKEGFISKGIEKYKKILRKYGNVEIVEIRSSQSKENFKILNKLRKNSYKIFLDLSGKEPDTFQFSKFIGSLIDSGVGNFDFVVGGAFGFQKEILKHADFIWKLSMLTFNHQIVRLILLEQVYRCLSIINNEKYHH